MIRYLAYVVMFVLFQIFARVINPALPAFRVLRYGPVRNNNGLATEPRLPLWMAWLDTWDNSLYGDNGWQTSHCPDYDSYRGMTRWLWRNCAKGFGLAIQARVTSVTLIKETGEGLRTDKGRDRYGSFQLRSDNGYFHYRSVKKWLGIKWAVEFGWQLNGFYSHPEKANKAEFIFQPSFPRLAR